MSGDICGHAKKHDFFSKMEKLHLPGRLTTSVVTTDLIPRLAKLPRKSPQVKTRNTEESSKYCLEAEMGCKYLKLLSKY